MKNGLGVIDTQRDVRYLEKVEGRLNKALTDEGREKLKRQTGNESIRLHVQNAFEPGDPHDSPEIALPIAVEGKAKELVIDGPEQRYWRQWYQEAGKIAVPTDSVYLSHADFDPKKLERIVNGIDGRIPDAHKQGGLPAVFFLYPPAWALVIK